MNENEAGKESIYLLTVVSAFDTQPTAHRHG